MCKISAWIPSGSYFPLDLAKAHGKKQNRLDEFSASHKLLDLLEGVEGEEEGRNGGEGGEGREGGEGPKTSAKTAFKQTLPVSLCCLLAASKA